MNDIWQGPSWASMEYGGRWKPLHYTVRRTFAPIALSWEKTSQNLVELHAVSDSTQDSSLNVNIELVRWID